MDRLETASGYWGNRNFVYDVLGNFKNKNLGTQQLTYSYDTSKNRLQSVTGGYKLVYDDRGNVLHNGKRSFNFNRANQITTSGNVTYQYDGHGRRVKKSAGTTSYSVYNKAGQLMLTDGPQGITRYIYLGKELIAKTGSSAALEDKPSYTGHLEDRDIGLTYMQQRYYDSVIGRFYSNDPIGFRDTHSFNRYAYANNNPYKFTDPTGMESESDNKRSGFCGVSGCDYSYSSGDKKDQEKKENPAIEVANTVLNNQHLNVLEVNKLWRSNNDASFEVTVDASKLHVIQLTKFGANRTAAARISYTTPLDWAVHGSVILYKEPGGKISILPGPYDFQSHGNFWSRPVRNAETYGGFYFGSIGGFSVGTDFLINYSGEPNVSKK